MDKHGMKQMNLNQNSTNNSHYIYQDWSNAPPNTSDTQVMQRELDLHPDAWKLPVKLNKILTNPSYSDAIEWLPHGRSWRIKDKSKLVNEVLPRYFQIANFNSFIRLVNAWGFRRIKFGNDIDSYFHELFLRGMPHLHIRMKRLLSKDKKIPLESKGQVPNFYAMPPLPAEKGGTAYKTSLHPNPKSSKHDDTESRLNPLDSSYFSILHRNILPKATTSIPQSTFPLILGDINAEKYSNCSHADGSRYNRRQSQGSPIEGQHKNTNTVQQNKAQTTTQKNEGFGITTRIAAYSREKLHPNNYLHQLKLPHQQHTSGMQRPFASSQVSLMAVRSQQPDLAHFHPAPAHCHSNVRFPNPPEMMFGRISRTKPNMQLLRASPSTLLAQTAIERWGDLLREGVQHDDSSRFNAMRASNFVLSPRYVFYRVPKSGEGLNQYSQPQVRSVDETQK